MKEILFNLALIDAINFCKENGIDCSGTHLYKSPKKQTYALIRDTDGKAILTTSFYKNRVPMHSFDKQEARHTHAYSGSTGECTGCNARVTIAR